MIKSSVLHTALHGAECSKEVGAALNLVAEQVVEDMMRAVTPSGKTLRPEDIVSAADRLFGPEMKHDFEYRILCLRHCGYRRRPEW